VVSEKACEQLPSGDVRPERRQLLVVDDHPVVRQGLVELLSKEADIAVIGTAADGEQAIQAARKLHPDIVLMDISMPGINGIQASRIITTEMPDVHVICLSMHEPMEMKYKMREAGAAFYFRKDGPMEDLIATIRSFPLRCKKGLSTTV
jgi:DNA-binding NarL/FixJ family response regulator